MKIQRIISLMAFSILLSGAVVAEAPDVAAIKGMDKSALIELLKTPADMQTIMEEEDATRRIAIINKIAHKNILGDNIIAALNTLSSNYKAIFVKIITDKKLKFNWFRNVNWFGPRKTQLFKALALTDDQIAAAQQIASADAPAALATPLGALAKSVAAYKTHVAAKITKQKGAVEAKISELKDRITADTRKITALNLRVTTAESKIADAKQKADDAVKAAYTKVSTAATAIAAAIPTDDTDPTWDTNVLGGAPGDFAATNIGTLLGKIQTAIDSADIPAAVAVVVAEGGDNQAPADDQPAPITADAIAALRADEITAEIMGQIHAAGANKTTFINKLIERVGVLALTPKQKEAVLLRINVDPYDTDDAYQALRGALAAQPAAGEDEEE